MADKLEVSKDQEVAYMETDPKMSVESSDTVTMNIESSENKDSVPKEDIGEQEIVRDNVPVQDDVVGQDDVPVQDDVVGQDDVAVEGEVTVQDEVTVQETEEVSEDSKTSEEFSSVDVETSEPEKETTGQDTKDDGAMSEEDKVPEQVTKTTSQPQPASNGINTSVPPEMDNQPKSKKKKSKELDHISRTMMQALNGLETPEEKIAALCKKYADLTAEHRLLANKFKVQQKQYLQLQREKDHLQSEHSKAILAKSKLESLCRELQRHNKVVKDDSIQRAKDEEEKRKELCAKFQQTINDISTQMQDNHTKNIKLKEENLELASKLKGLVEQYERREEHIEKTFKHKEIELQLSEAKLQEAKMNIAQEREISLKEKTILQLSEVKLQESNLKFAQETEKHLKDKAILLSEVADYQRKCELLQAQEIQLKSQLAVYTEKFEEFQGTLTKSNEVFQQFKQEMDKMTKKIKKLQKDNQTWRSRWETCNKSLMELAEEKTTFVKDMQAQDNKIQKLEKLCRALQAERNALDKKTKEGGGSCSPSPAPTPPPLDLPASEPEKSDSDEVVESLQENLNSDDTTTVDNKPPDSPLLVEDPVTTSSTAEGEDPVTTSSTAEGEDLIATMSTAESEDLVTTTSTAESEDLVTTASTAEGEDPVTTTSTAKGDTENNEPSSTPLEKEDGEK
ncbi:beta-taxilin-like [Glandiceps talaboti]